MRGRFWTTPIGDRFVIAAVHGNRISIDGVERFDNDSKWHAAVSVLCRVQSQRESGKGKAMSEYSKIGLTDDSKRSRYQRIYDNTRTMTLMLSGLSVEQIEAAGAELQVGFEVFLLDYTGPRLSDDHEYFVEMLRQWVLPWARDEMSALNGLTVAQFFLAFGWEKNATAKWLFGVEAIHAGWSDEMALDAGIGAIVSAAKCLASARVLMASGEDKLAQGAL